MIDGYSGSPVVRAGLRLAPMLFVRPGELRHMRWVDLDLDAGEWRYTVSKTRTQHIVPIPQQALAILDDLKQLTGNYPFALPSARSGDRPLSDNAMLAAMRRLGIAKETMTGHGWRATARTILDEVLGFRVDFIEHQLAHAVRDPNGRAADIPNVEFQMAAALGRVEIGNGDAPFPQRLPRAVCVMRYRWTGCYEPEPP
jgi:integrase